MDKFNDFFDAFDAEAVSVTEETPRPRKSRRRKNPAKRAKQPKILPRRIPRALKLRKAKLPAIKPVKERRQTRMPAVRSRSLP